MDIEHGNSGGRTYLIKKWDFTGSTEISIDGQVVAVAHPSFLSLGSTRVTTMPSGEPLFRMEPPGPLSAATRDVFAEPNNEYLGKVALSMIREILVTSNGEQKVTVKNVRVEFEGCNVFFVGAPKHYVIFSPSGKRIGSIKNLARGWNIFSALCILEYYEIENMQYLDPRLGVAAALLSMRNTG